MLQSSLLFPVPFFPIIYEMYFDYSFCRPPLCLGEFRVTLSVVLLFSLIRTEYSRKGAMLLKGTSIN